MLVHTKCWARTRANKDLMIVFVTLGGEIVISILENKLFYFTNKPTLLFAHNGAQFKYKK